MNLAPAIILDIEADAERDFTRDRTDDLIEAAVMARLTGMSRAEAVAIIHDCFDVVYSEATRRLR